MACHPGRETVFPSQKRPNLLILKLFVLKTAIKAGTMPGFLTRGFFQRLGITQRESGLPIQAIED